MTEERPIRRIIKAAELDADGFRRLFRDARVVRREVLENVAAVQHAIDSARQAAAQLREDAIREADEIRAEARQQGRKDGIQQTLKLVAAAEVLRADARRNSERDMLDLAFGLAERIVGRALDSDSSVFADLVADKLGRVRAAPRIVVKVAPNAVRELEKSRAELAAHVDGVPITFEPDGTLEAGDCIIETDRGRIDARLAVQLQTLREALQQGEES